MNALHFWSLQDEERTKIAMNQVPSLEQMNEMLARTPAEQQLFAQLDRELEWPSPAHSAPLSACFAAYNLCLVPH